MSSKNDPFILVEIQDETFEDNPDETFLITVQDYYDLLMEQQEQM